MPGLKQGGAVLVIDEIDSILFSRVDAVRSWEVSFTNEFLAQMERFRGVLICTTNRMESLDSASIRRFNHKIGFDYLTGQGNLVFYDRLLGQLADGRLSAVEKSHLRSLKKLTPGDFKIVRDRFSFMRNRMLNHSSLIQALEEEIEVKMKQMGRPVGF